MFRRGYFLLFLLVSLLFVGCSTHQKLLKSSDNDLKYQAAIAYYNKKDYYRALQLFEQLNPFYRGTARGERIGYYQAFCYFEQKDYLLADYYFDSFAKTFPMSKDAEEALYMSAICKFRQSPHYSLDQTRTREAIDKFNAFLAHYPNSNRKEDCNRMVETLTKKLAKKDFEIAKLHFHTMEYEAAVVCFVNLMNDYSETSFAEEANFYIVRSYYHFADNSVVARKKERFQKCIDAYNDFVVNYPESKFLKDAKKLDIQAKAAIYKLGHPKKSKREIEKMLQEDAS